MESKKPTTKYLVKLMLKSSDNNPYTGKLSLSANIFAAIQLAELCKTFSLTGQEAEAMYVSSNQWEEVIDRLKEVKKLIGEMDAEKKAEEYADFSNDYVPLTFGDKFNTTTKRDYLAGYNQALEDNKEKKYTEEDMVEAFKMGLMKLSDQRLKDYMQPKTEWEVEFVDGKLKLK